MINSTLRSPISNLLKQNSCLTLSTSSRSTVSFWRAPADTIMAPKSDSIQWSEINNKDFKQYLAQYPDLINHLSTFKSTKDDQKTLQELDEYRFHDATDRFGLPEPSNSMKLDDVQKLVEWKLRHGKFRPTLMKLVSSNDPDTAQNIIKKAIDGYQMDANTQVALDVLTKLKGIGPATASLLLAVHDPTRVIFFSDEAFYWLCCNGKKATIKYNAKEYRLLCSNAQELCNRLDVTASDVEKTAYVLMRQSDQRPKPNPTHDGTAKRNLGSSTKKRKPDPKTEETADTIPIEPLRRSKRTKVYN